MTTKDYVPALGALTGGQAVEMVKAGLDAIYVSGWQVAADANLAGQTYPDQSLYPVNSVPNLVRRINNALQRADQIAWADGDTGTYWMAPIVADAEAGFGGALNTFELMKSLIESGAAGVHFEDQLASEKKCGHLGGKVLVPTSQFIKTLSAARLAADVLGVPTVLVARTDAESATLLTSDVDEADRPFRHGRPNPGGLLPHPERHRDRDRPGARVRAVRGRGLVRDLDPGPRRGAQRSPRRSTRRFPGKLLAYNCSPSFNWRTHLDDETIAGFQRELGAMGYRFQFITLAGFHALNASMFELAHGYADEGMSAYVRLQEREFELESLGYSATRHQAEVGTGYFDRVSEIVSRGTASTLALAGSTERAQFRTPRTARATVPNRTGGDATRSRRTERSGADRRLRVRRAAPVCGDGSGVGGSGSGTGPGSGCGVGTGPGDGGGSGSGISERLITPPLLSSVGRLARRSTGSVVSSLSRRSTVIRSGSAAASGASLDLVTAGEQQDLVAVAGLPQLGPTALRILVHHVREDARAADRAALLIRALRHAGAYPSGGARNHRSR